MSCHCLQAPFNFEDYEISHLGVDDSGGRYAEVTLEKCRTCGTWWLKYLIEQEWHSNSGRWYRGQISDEEAKRVTTHNAAAMLGGLEWHFYGGSYFNSRGVRADGGADVER